MRVLIGFQEIAGYNEELKNSLNSIGINTTFINLYGDKYEYGKNKPNFYISKLQKLRKQLLVKRTLLRVLNIIFVKSHFSFGQYQALIFSSLPRLVRSFYCMI